MNRSGYFVEPAGLGRIHPLLPLVILNRLSLMPLHHCTITLTLEFDSFRIGGFNLEPRRPIIRFTAVLHQTLNISVVHLLALRHNAPSVPPRMHRFETVFAHQPVEISMSSELLSVRPIHEEPYACVRGFSSISKALRYSQPVSTLLLASPSILPCFPVWRRNWFESVPRSSHSSASAGFESELTGLSALPTLLLDWD